MTLQKYEKLLDATHPRWVMGVDEVGVGAWAGPVYVAAALVPPDFTFPGLRDSKQIKEEARDAMYGRLVEAVGPGWFWLEAHSAEHIDRVGIRAALTDAIDRLVARARDRLSPSFHPCLLVMDGDVPPVTTLPNVRSVAMPKADTFVPAVMAASNIAKVWRDRYMRELDQDERAGRFGFAKHKGYGTEQHRQLLEQTGICSEHRVSYRPVRLNMYKGRKP